MLSRVADSLYWMSRYLERADGILRMLKINYASSQGDLQEFSWKPVLRLFTYMKEEEANTIAYDSRAVLQYMVTDKENPNSLVNIVTHARENARAVQDHITKEVWQCLNDYYHAVRDERLAHRLHKEDPISTLDVLIKQGLLYYGTADITMARGEGYAFINIGKYLERALQSADILDVKFSDAHFDFSKIHTTYWKYLLLSFSGYELYLKTYKSGFDAKNVVGQIVLNKDFPRSVIYSINRLSRYFERLENQGNKPGYETVEFLIGKLKSEISYTTVDMIEDAGLHNYLIKVKKELSEVANALNKNYFAYS
ncbi:MAG: alpha-E domain-containing protein [Bacteroidetes bacterium]|nr:alpha-E domain-containing protein [Bacteroidota bacterium]MBS1974404.1 alpha-E domain-containing protein [Bacteroidota bacterium]